MQTDHDSAAPTYGSNLAGDAPPGSGGSRRWLLIVALLAVALVALVSWRLMSANKGAAQMRARFGGMSQPVGVATIATRDVRIILNQLGTVSPLATVTVQSQLSGQLMEIAFKEGQLVHKGDFLAQIDPRPYQVALAQYQAQLLRDQAVLSQARTDLERYHALQERDSIAKQTVDDQEWLVKQAEGTVRLDQAQVDAQKLNLTYCHVVAPVTGRVGLRQVDVGNYVQANSSTGLVVVTELHPISVVFTVPEDAVPPVYAHLHAGKALPVVAWDRANTRQLAAGTLNAIDTQVDTTTGTVKMRALFDNADDLLYPQQFVNAQLLVDTLHDAVAVPVAAVQYGSGGPFVYRLGDGDVVGVRSLQLGPQDGEWIAVKSGLAAGDRVVVDGLDQLKDGAHVSVRDGSAAPAAGAGQDAARARRGQGGGDAQRGEWRRKNGEAGQPAGGAAPK